MPTFAATDLAGITTAISSMTSAYWIPLIGVLAVLVVIRLTPKVIKVFTK